MKRAGINSTPRVLLLICFFQFFPVFVLSQDIIYMGDGEEIQAKVSRVSAKEVSYHRADHLDGPEYTIYTDGIFMIKFENGNTEIINQISELQKEGNPLDSAEVCSQAQVDAQTSYMPKGPMIGTYVTSLVIMPAGLVYALIVSNKPPSEESLAIATQNYQDNDEYLVCYFNEAKEIKKKRVWMSFWSGWATGMAIAALIIAL